MTHHTVRVNPENKSASHQEGRATELPNSDGFDVPAEHVGARREAGVKPLLTNDILVKVPDWSHVTPLIDRLRYAASGHPGEFLVSTVGSEDPETGAARRTYHFHPANDEQARKRLLHAINGIAVGGDNKLAGFNCYVGMALMKPGLAPNQKGTEEDVAGVIAAPLDFDGKHDPATRRDRLPLPPHAEVETSPGQFQTWYFFDRPYSVAEAKPVLTALARATGPIIPKAASIFSGCREP